MAGDGNRTAVVRRNETVRRLHKKADMDERTSPSINRGMELTLRLLSKEIKSLHAAESYMARTLPHLAARAGSVTLQFAFQTRLDEKCHQLQRLKEAAQMLRVPVEGSACKGVEAVIHEGCEALAAGGIPLTQDVQLLLMARRVAAYEIDSYQAAILFAGGCGQARIAEWMAENLREEMDAEQSYWALAVRLLGRQPKDERTGNGLHVSTAEVGCAI